MRNVREIALSAFAALALGSAPAIAGEWSSGCGVCQLGYHAPPATYYTQPTYAYAAPTVTVVPHVIVEPNYIVQQTYVVRQNHYADDLPPCWLGCEPHRVVNQGQYPSPEYFAGRPADVYSGYRRGLYRLSIDSTYGSLRRTVAVQHPTRAYWGHAVSPHYHRSVHWNHHRW